MSGYLLAASGTYNYTLASASSGFILDASAGTFAYAGNPATFLYSAFNLSAASGSYAYTGKAATLSFAPNPTPLSAAAGTYAYTGKSAQFILTPAPPYLVANAGIYSIAGQDATLTFFAPGTFPNVIGLSLQMAQQTLEDAGALNPSKIGYFGNWPITVTWVQSKVHAGKLMQPGIVTSQQPAPGARIVVNAPIVLTVTEVPVGVATPPSQANF